MKIIRRGAMLPEDYRQQQWRTLVHALGRMSRFRLRLIIMFAAVGILIWHLYMYAWLPLTAAVEFPEGVAASNATLDTKALTNIRDLRLERLQHAPVSFRDTNQYFHPLLPSPSP